MKDHPDRHVLEGLRSAESGAFEAAFRDAYASHRSVVYGFLRRLSGDPDTAADLFQNVWLKLARHRRRLSEDTDLRAWLCAVARREYLSYRRAQTLDLGRLLTFGREPSEPSGTPGDPRLHEVNAALQRLADCDREVLLLTSVDGLSMRQAAAVLAISEPALRQRLLRARRRLTTAVRKQSASQNRRGWFGVTKKEQT
jgi:RNA polymerase sigma-70 factor (ECF subfamily)